MLQNYLPIYQIALDLEMMRARARLLRDASSTLAKWELEGFRPLLEAIITKCPDYGCGHSADLAKRVLDRPPPKTYDALVMALDHLNNSLTNELEKEAVFRIPSERKDFFELDDLFGPKVAAAFPSCERDIRKAGSCYALAQEDACVHHLMMVLERGLSALATKIGITYQRINWQPIINDIRSRLNSMSRGPERDFYNEVLAQFEFLKVAYRNHSEHARDDPYDMPKALHIFNHVRDFMQALEKDGLKE